jgi:Leucine-rich repeat (LRR) protein
MLDLEELFLDDNAINGTLPTEMGLLTKLRHLVVSSNELTGTAPSSLGAYSYLRTLAIGQNEITGTEDLLDAICALRPPGGPLAYFSAD